MTWIWIAAISLVGVLIVGAYYIGTAYLAAFYEVRSRPKEPMLWCHVHGMIRKKHAIDLGYTQVCPICYKEALTAAEQS